MHRLRTVGILAAIAVFVAACTGPTPPGDTFTLDVAVAGDGTGSVTFDTPGGDPAVGSSEIASGTEVTLVATADAGSEFAGWSGDCTGEDATCVLTMDSDKAVTATFDDVDEPLPDEVPLTVTISGSGGGNVTQAELGIDCDYDPGAGQSGPCEAAAASTSTAYTFTATPATDMVFGGWGGGAASCGTDLTCAVTPDANPFTVTATFTDPTAPEPNSGSVAIATTEDDGFEWLADPATDNDLDTTGNTFNDLRQIGLSYLHRYGVEIVSGFAFRDLDIPQGAEIQDAYIQFTSIVRSAGSGPAGSYDPTDGNEVTVTIEVQDSLNPAGIPKRDPTEPYENNLTGRAKVAALEVQWNIPDWPNRAEATEAQRTPNLAALLQALVDKPEWTAGESDVMFLISNADGSPETGWRQVADFSETEGDPGEYAAVLHFTYSVP